MRLAFVIPWRDLGSWLWESLGTEHQGTLLFAAPEPNADNSPRASKLPPYIAEFWQLLTRRYQLREFDIVFAWELRSALATALLRKLQRASQTKFVVVGPILKGGVLRLLPLVRWLLSSADTILCFSQSECDDYAALLKLPRSRFQFWPLPWSAPSDVPEPTDDGFVLALGQSNRDYATLFNAVDGLSIPVVVVAADETPFGGVKPPSNVTVRFNTPHPETNRLIASATFHVVPLHPAGFSSGQTVLLRAMASEKACVVSAIPGVQDYVLDRETAILVPPHDSDALKMAIEELWAGARERERLGRNARHYVESELGFPRFTERLVALAAELLR